VPSIHFQLMGHWGKAFQQAHPVQNGKAKAAAKAKAKKEPAAKAEKATKAEVASPDVSQSFAESDIRARRSTDG